MIRRNLTKREEMESIILKSEICHVGMCDLQCNPYVVPFNFVFHEGYVYLHSAMEGKKIDILKQNKNVSAVFSIDHELGWRDEHVACSWGMRYRSVMINGKVEFIEEYDKKMEVLNTIMKKYAGREFSFNKPAVVNVCIYRIAIGEMTGRVYGYTL